ncbi:hypothetical protein ES708_30595 [subsurface metagenome]
MKSKTVLKLFLIFSLLVSFSCQQKKGGNEEMKKENDITQYLGQWTLDIDGGTVGWLEVRQEDGYLDGSLMWIGGSVTPVSYMYLVDNVLYAGRNTRKVIRKRDAEGTEIRSQMVSTWIEAEKEGEKIAGYYLRPNRNGIGLDSTSFVGTKLPDVGPAPDLSALKFGTPITLLNGKDLTGWKLVEPNKINGWSVVDGALINNPVQKEGEQPVQYGNLRTEQEFEDFNIKLEVNVPAHSNSGVYLRGRYEIQVVDSYGAKQVGTSMGALYTRVTPGVAAEKPAGSWQTIDITLCDRHVTVILNGIKIIDNQPAFGPTGGALTSDVFAPGPIYLQGDHGTVSYRNIVITPIIK